MDLQKVEILFNGCYCGEEVFKEIVEGQDIPMSFAQEKLEDMIFRGFNYNNNVNLTAVSAIPVRAYPGNKKLRWKFIKPITLDNVKVKQLSFINILIIKQIMFMLESLVTTFKWCFKNRKNQTKVMLSYSANPPVVLPMLAVCKLWGVKNVILVTEIPKYRLFDGQTSWLRDLLLKIMLTVSSWLHECFDGYILLTEYMKDEINKEKKPYIVIEGMVDINENGQFITKNYLKKKRVILYTGTLNREYGLPTLIKGFQKIGKQDVELWFCGQGNFQDEIKIASKSYNNIRYLGMLPHKDVTEVQSKADFLINPRPTDSEYTKYSFPSKTMEYMLTGIPVITTKLKGIPEEYNEYLIFVEDETAEGYCKHLWEILNADYNEFKNQAERGRRFIVNNKTVKNQTKKIIEFIKEVIDTKHF